MKKLVIIFSLLLWASVCSATTIKDDMKYTGDVAFTGDHTMAEYSVNLSSVFVDGVGPITSSSAPNCTTVDNVAAIVYDSSAEEAEIQFTHAVTKTFKGLQIKVMATSSGNSPTETSLDWAVYAYKDGVALGTVLAQTGMSFTETSLTTTADEVTLTLNAAGIAAVTGGATVLHIAIWNVSTTDFTTEIKGIRVKEL